MAYQNLLPRKLRPNAMGEKLTHAPDPEALAVYTDGSCFPNPGPGGWAFVIPSIGIEAYGACREPTTNNRMEMQAIIEALKVVVGTGPVRIYTDSQWAIGVLASGWKAKANLDLIHEAKALMRRERVSFEWVRGHAGNAHNHRADLLAGMWRNVA